MRDVSRGDLDLADFDGDGDRLWQAAADLDGDGDEDGVATDFTSDGVQWYGNSAGDGTAGNGTPS